MGSSLRTLALVVVVVGCVACGSVSGTPDASPPCPGNLTSCGEFCVNTSSDNLNCGECDNACMAGLACSASECRLTCQLGLLACGNRCVDPDTDAMNCGASGDCLGPRAGEVCGAGEVCNGNGTCAGGCDPGLVSCGGTCVDPLTDESFCGASGSCAGSQAGAMCGPADTCSNGTCTPPVSPRIVFATSQLYTGNLGGLAGADAICQQHAANAGLAGTYKAWLADATAAPANRFTAGSDPYVLVTGTVIANGFADLLDGVLLAPISLTETGGPAPVGNTACGGGGSATVWSNVNADGTRFDPVPPFDYGCLDWTSDADNMAAWGLATDATQAWSSWCNGGTCAWLSAIYCFQQ